MIFAIIYIVYTLWCELLIEYLAYTVERVNDNLDVFGKSYDLTFLERRSISTIREIAGYRPIRFFLFLPSCFLFVYTFVFVVAARQRDARKKLVSRWG